MEMKHYKDASGKIYGFATNGSQNHLIPAGLVEIDMQTVQDLDKIASEIVFNKLDYRRKRISSYPDISEFVDAWVKGDESALENYRQDCLAVKAKYPKPPGF